MPAAPSLRTMAATSVPRLLRLGGEIDLNTAPALREQLLAVPPTDDVIIDMSDVRFFGAAAVTLLLELRARLRHEGHTLQLTAVPRVVRRLLDLAALLDVLPCSFLTPEPSPSELVPSPTSSLKRR